MRGEFSYFSWFFDLFLLPPSFFSLFSLFSSFCTSLCRPPRAPAISGEMSGGRRRAAFYPHSWNFVSNLYTILSFDFSFLAVCEDGFDLGFKY